MTKEDRIVALPMLVCRGLEALSRPDIVYDISPDGAVSHVIARAYSDMPQDERGSAISETMAYLRDRIGASEERIKQKTSLVKYTMDAQEVLTAEALSTRKGKLRENENIPYDKVTPELLSERIARHFGRLSVEFLDVAKEYINH